MVRSSGMILAMDAGERVALLLLLSLSLALSLLLAQLQLLHDGK
jgi:hypothetical protein